MIRGTGRSTKGRLRELFTSYPTLRSETRHALQRRLRQAPTGRAEMDVRRVCHARLSERAEMSPYVLIITLAMSSYDGGVSVQWVPFATRSACESAAKFWDGRDIGHRYRTKVNAYCHDTGARDVR